MQVLNVQMEWQTVQTLILYEQFDLGLHYLSTPVCLKKLDHYISWFWPFLFEIHMALWLLYW